MVSVVRGDIVRVLLDPTVGTEIGKTRPCVVVQNNVGNEYSPRTIVIPATGAENVVRTFPIHVHVDAGEGGFSKASMILCDQIRTVDKGRLMHVIGHLTASTMVKVDAAVKISLALK
jgi:mRNA interferase MazF